MTPEDNPTAAPRPVPRPPRTALTAQRPERRVGLGSFAHSPVSRCTQPRKTPLDWIYYRGALGTLEDEILEVISGLPQAEAEMVIAEMNAIVDGASMGQLDFDEDVDMVSIDPDMWELRLPAGGKLYRLYIVEPSTHPDHLIALRFHQKRVDFATQQEIDDAQDAEIAQAALRFRSGIASDWGHAA